MQPQQSQIHFPRKSQVSESERGASEKSDSEAAIRSFWKRKATEVDGKYQQIVGEKVTTAN
jgi:hypothetical protein